jgi:hypothetical protein
MRPWRSLAHRWFVEYNPLYLLSAALVLGGCFVWSSDLTRQESLVESLGIAAVAELYAFSLIGGAALLVRIGLRRPAVMLALLFALFQWDLTLHTETCAYLGAPGAWAAAAWVALFGVKLHLLARALRVRFAGHAVAAAVVAAAGIALAPYVLPILGDRGAGAAIALWAFGLGAMYRSEAIASVDPLDAWGCVVLRRATRAAWLVSAGLASVHVFFWWRDHAVDLAALLPVVPLCYARRATNETRAWGLVIGTLVVTAAFFPAAFSGAALLAALALCLRRALVGALFAAYLAVWTWRWTGGALPQHLLVLDLALTVLALVATKRTRLALAPLAATYLHFALQARLVPPPRTRGEWGAVAVALGFLLLGGSLAATYRLSRSAKGG